RGPRLCREAVEVSTNAQSTKWECKYHVVFIPKCRRKTFVCGTAEAFEGEGLPDRLTERKESRGTRKDKFSDVWPEAKEQLSANPGLEAKRSSPPCSENTRSVSPTASCEPYNGK